jgi:hypothetical protein
MIRIPLEASLGRASKSPFFRLLSHGRPSREQRFGPSEAPSISPRHDTSEVFRRCGGITDVLLGNGLLLIGDE